MKIALISNFYPPNIVGGAEKVVHMLAEGFADRGHQVNVLTFAFDGKHQREQINGVCVDRILPCNLYSPKKQHLSTIVKAIWHTLDSYNPNCAHKVKKWLKQVKPDVVNSHVIAGFSPSIWKRVKLEGIPIVHTIHDQYLLCPRTTMFRNGQICQSQCLSCRIYSLPRLKSTQYINTVVGVSRFILDHHRNFAAFPLAKQVVINNGTKFSEKPAIHRQSFTDGQRGIRFGFLGKINESKGIHNLINAFLQLEPHQAELWIAGKGSIDYEAKLKELTRHRLDIKWLGFINPNELLRNIEVLVLPSLWNDTAPLVIHEAFSYGIPVIGSKRGGISELISPDVGWIFDPDKSHSLVEILRDVIQNRENLSLLKDNITRRSKEFTCEGMISAYLKEYKELLQKGY